MGRNSGVVWLASSSAEISRARDVLRTLTPTGVLDELGFLVLQAALADRMYPATNTLMTRARYLIFVPAIYRYLETQAVTSASKLDDQARDLQDALSQALLRQEPVDVIGSSSGRNIIRPPSAIYWVALGELGLARQRTPEGSYQQRVAGGERAHRVRDTESPEPETPETLWDSRVHWQDILPNGSFPATTNFRLRRTEATLLRECYDALRPDGHASVLSHLIELGRRMGGKALDAIAAPWDVPELPGEQSMLAMHAERLSLFACGVTLQYHRMLIEAQGVEDPGAAEAFEGWWAEAREPLATWSQKTFFDLATMWRAERKSLGDREFFDGWISRCVSASSAALALADPALQAIVSRRERDTRPGRARLSGGHYLTEWKCPRRFDTPYRHYFRHEVGLQFAMDIADGLGGQP